MFVFAAAPPARASVQSLTDHQQSRLACTQPAWGRAPLSLVLCCMALPAALPAQNPTPASKSAPASQTLPRVTTTVVVRGEAKDDYLPDTVAVGSLDGATLAETPLSATVGTPVKNGTR